jgi:hypothetical protein
MGTVELDYVESIAAFSLEVPGYQAINVPMGCGATTLTFALVCSDTSVWDLYVFCSGMFGPAQGQNLSVSRDPFNGTFSVGNLVRCCTGSNFGTSTITFQVTE